ncbi:MAG: glycosyltransferase family 92 protein [Bacteroidota bacterium]
MQLDLRQITFYVINDNEDYEKRAIMENQLNRLGLTYLLVPAASCQPPYIQHALSRLKIFNNDTFELPFVILHDFAVLKDPLQYVYDVPDETDALYLGPSPWGIHSTSGEMVEAHFEWYDEQFIRLNNALGATAIVVLSERFRTKAVEIIYKALLHHDAPYDPVQEFTLLQQELLVLSPIANPIYPSARWCDDQHTTQDALLLKQLTNDFTAVFRAHEPKSFELYQDGTRSFYLFYDIFVHWSQKKITAVAPHYGSDADMATFHQNIWLETAGVKVKGRYIPCALDSWEPSIIIDFEDDRLADIIAKQTVISIKVTCGHLTYAYNIHKYIPRYELSMSLVIKKRIRWIEQYIQYYIDIMKLDHIYFYINELSATDWKELVNITLPYIKQAKVTLIRWEYRWRNQTDKKQLAQPVQETHALNKYGHGKWIGLFDLDEFLKIPNQTIKQFLGQYDPSQVGGVSFGLRWFFYKGKKKFEQIDNPLLEYIYSKKDEQGRKRQKLFVSPKLARYAGFHWIPKGLKEIKVDDSDIFFHHYYFHEDRFQKGKSQAGTVDRSLAHLFQAYSKTMHLEQHLDDALKNASQKKSRIDEAVLATKGAGLSAKHFFNSILSTGSRHLLYIGNFNPAIIKALITKRFFIGTFLCPVPKAREQDIIEEIRYLAEACRLKLFNANWRKVDASFLEKEKYGYFIYSGSIDYQQQYDAILHFYEKLENFAVLILDNWNELSIQNATRDALKELAYPVLFKRKLRTTGRNNPQWGNGICIIGIGKVKTHYHLASPFSQ